MKLKISITVNLIITIYMLIMAAIIKNKLAITCGVIPFGIITIILSIIHFVREKIENTAYNYYKQKHVPKYRSKSVNDIGNSHKINLDNRDDIHNEIEETKQYIKKPLLSATELKFGRAIKKCLPAGYMLKAQICLASIIIKTENNYYANELFRIIDFGIFDKKYNVKILIEINDESHYKKERQIRDYKVKDICEEANIPLIRLWTDYGINEEYIKKKINEYLN